MPTGSHGSDEDVQGDLDHGRAVLGIGAGIAVAYLLFRLLRGRSGPGGVGPGGPAREDRSVRAPGPTFPASAPAPPLGPPVAAPVAVPPPAIEALVRPDPADPARAVVEVEGRAVSVGELVARVDQSGRTDVVVRVRGDTRRGSWEEIRDALGFAGIRVLRKV